MPTRQKKAVLVEAIVQPTPVDNTASGERIEDIAFENLIKRWTEAREWEWVMAANVMYGKILEERERDK